jgi:hypothetical protein
MGSPSSRRKVDLIDARATGRPLVAAEVYREFPSAELDEIESSWSIARERAEAERRAAGLTPVEHAHWDWRNKVDSVEAGHHMLVAVERHGEVQEIIAVLREPRHSQHTNEPIVYVDYLESAPWNLKGFSAQPRFLGIGTVLIAEAVRLSLEAGFGGRVGLHSLPQAEEFYRTRCRMTEFGADPYYFDLVYFEYIGQQATEWLAAIGESP